MIRSPIPKGFLEDDLSPPVNRFHVLSRASLIAALREHFDKKLILVTAGAGWGKTTFLASYVTTLRHPYAWYTLSDKEKDPDRLLTRLYERIRQIDPKREFQTRYSLKDVWSGKITWTAFGASLMHMMSQMYPQKIILILDDFHHLESSESLVRFFEDFIKRAPLNLQIIVSSRRQPGIQLSKYKLYGYVHEIETRDLAFTYEECRELVYQCYGLSLPQTDLYGLMQYSSGWPVAIRLLGAALVRSGGKSFLNEGKPTGKEIDVEAYFESQVLSPLPSEVKRFLTEASIFESIDHEICHSVLAWPNSDSVLDRLYREGLFLDQFENTSKARPKFYRYHALFRHFLLERLKKEITPDRFNDLNVKAGQYFAGEKKWGEALTHFIHAKEYLQVADLLMKALEENLRKGSAQTLIYWIKSIPDEVIQNYPQIIYAQATAYFLTGDWNRALDSIELCVSKTRTSGPPALHATAMQLLIILNFSLDKYAESIALADDLKKAVKEESPIWAYAEAMNALALMQIAGYQPAADAWKNLEGHPAFEADKGLKMENDTQKAVGFYFLSGKVDAALGILDKAVTYLRGSDFMGRLGRSLFFLAFIQYETGNLNTSYISITEAIKEFTNNGNYHRLCAAHSLEILILLELGRLDEAAERMLCMDQMLSDGFIANEWKSYFYHMAKADLALCQERHVDFEKEAQKAIKQVRTLSYWNDTTLIFPALALRYARVGKTGYAMDLLAESLSAANSSQALFRCATINLLTAYLHHSQKNRDEDDRHLESALSLAQKNNYDSLFLSKYREIAQELLPYALERRLRLDYACHLVIRMNGNSGQSLIESMKKATNDEKRIIVKALADHRCRDSEAYLAALTRSKDNDLRRQAENALSIVSCQSPIALRIQTLGEFSVCLGDRKITHKEWKRKSAKAIFIYLALHAHKDIRIDSLIDIFFATLPLKAARTNIHQAVSTIRKVLEPGIMPKRESAYIKGGDGIYHFVLPQGSEIDALRFEEFCKQAQRALNSGDRSLSLAKFTEALSIYQGDFLIDDSDYGWNTDIRIRLQDLYASTLLVVSEMHFKLYSYEDCIKWLTLLLAADPFEERAYYMLMRCHYALGDRPKVIKIFNRCKAVLCNELGIEPGADILELYHQVRA